MKPIFADDAAIEYAVNLLRQAAWLHFQPRRFTDWVLMPPILMQFGEFFKPKAGLLTILSLSIFPVLTALTIGR